jgi:ribonuclease P protein component
MEGHDQPSAIKYSFSKEERLHNKKMIQELFDKGSSFFLYPFKVFYLPDKQWDSDKNKVLVSVSKKFFKKAVERNLIKRRIREAYRLNKHIISSTGHDSKPLLVGVIFVGKQILSFNEIETKLKLVLMRLNEVRFK